MLLFKFNKDDFLDIETMDFCSIIFDKDFFIMRLKVIYFPHVTIIYGKNF